MKIAFITLGFNPLRLSGLDLSGERLVRGLLTAKNQVTVIAGRKTSITETSDHPDLEIVRLPLDRSDWIGFGYRVAKLLSYTRGFDIVHFWDVHFGWAYHRDFVASIQHSFHQRIESLGKPAGQFSIRWIYRYIYYSLAMKYAEIPSIQRAMLLLAGSSTTKDEFQHFYGIDPGRILVAPHGVDTNFFQKIHGKDLIRQRFGLQPEEPVILFASFITPRKGLEYLAQAIPMIKPKPKLIIAGKWRDNAYRKKVWKILEPIQDSIIETGFVADVDMPGLFSIADLYVSPSLLEGFGLPVAEALACEIPVVAVDAGAVAEVMGPGGILVEPRNPFQLARAISTLLQEPTLRQEMGKLGRAHIQTNFSVQSMVDSTIKAYESIR